MSPFLHFRSWWRTGPVGERVLTAVAGTLLLALVVWASTPSDGTATDSLPGAPGGTPVATTGSGTTGGAGGATGTTGASAGSGAGGAVTTGGTTTGGTTGSLGGTTSGAGTTGAAGASGGTGTTSTGKSCGEAGATDQGVTATTITIGVIVVDLGSANNIISVPSAADQQKAHTAVINSINARGGVRCRKLVANFYADNPLDSSSEHSLCLKMAQDKVFAVFNNLYTSTEQTCVAKQGIPNVWYTPPHDADLRTYAPYILSWQADFDRLIRQYVRASTAVGWFNGMGKLGILEGSCFPDENTAVAKELKAIGIDPGKAEVFNYGCTGAPAPQSDQSAVLQFQRAGVTHVLNVAFTYDSDFSRAGDQQGYAPKFAHMEDASATSIESASQSPGKSFDNTLLISAIETGAAHTPGYAFNKPTQECTALLKAAGLPAPYGASGASLLGVACVDGAMFKNMADSAPRLTRKLLTTGLVRAGTQTLSYPAGPLTVTDPALPTSGLVSRTGRWHSSCNCWQVTDARYRAY